MVELPIGLFGVIVKWGILFPCWVFFQWILVREGFNETPIPFLYGLEPPFFGPRLNTLLAYKKINKCIRYYYCFVCVIFFPAWHKLESSWTLSCKKSNTRKKKYALYLYIWSKGWSSEAYQSLLIIGDFPIWGRCKFFFL